MINKIPRHYIGNINTLSANIKFVCASFRNRKKNEGLASFSFCFEASTNTFFTSEKCMYIIFIVKYHVFTKFLNLYTKRQKHLTFCLNFHLGVYSMFPVLPVSIVLCSSYDTGYQETLFV